MNNSKADNKRLPRELVWGASPLHKRLAPQTNRYRKHVVQSQIDMCSVAWVGVGHACNAVT